MVQKMFKDMSWYFKLSYCCGTVLLIIGSLYLIGAALASKYTPTPNDIISLGMGFVGLTIAVNEWK